MVSCATAMTLTQAFRNSDGTTPTVFAPTEQKQNIEPPTRFNLLPSVGSWCMCLLPKEVIEPPTSSVATRPAAPIYRSTANLPTTQKKPRRAKHTATRRTPSSLQIMKSWKLQRSFLRLAKHEQKAPPITPPKGIRQPCGHEPNRSCIDSTLDEKVSMTIAPPCDLNQLKVGHVAGDGNCTWRALSKACAGRRSWAAFKKGAMRDFKEHFQAWAPRGVWAGVEAYKMTAVMEKRTLRVYTESHTFTFTPQNTSPGPMARIRVTHGHATHVIDGEEKPCPHFASKQTTAGMHDLVAGHARIADEECISAPVTGRYNVDPASSVRFVPHPPFGCGWSKLLVLGALCSLSLIPQDVVFPCAGAHTPEQQLSAGGLPWLDLRAPSIGLTTKLQIHEYHEGRPTDAAPRSLFVPRGVTTPQLTLLVAEHCALAPSWTTSSLAKAQELLYWDRKLLALEGSPGPPLNVNALYRS
eukprot:6490459-Amphidinium_carterae.1